MRRTPYARSGPDLSVEHLACIVPPRGGQGEHCPDTRPVAPVTPAAERRAREDVRERLVRGFPDVAPEELDAVVAEEFGFFATARIRHYVPVLVFKKASRRLAARPGAARGGTGGEDG
ncbi:three-helix bundle dimerization domain-containing protein [Streptomyces sp. GC420]|uniref:three-helix bundle dimerization domain-containing protein n=1 Tax=Streptomyces sp. GC420 TaxID=2697568 RepID=UPI001415084D|nr:hypothetical protein [Streptomyces sp. GC420]NBM17289.1 hypothetical protein [Streptomyces sp. GC420]